MPFRETKLNHREVVLATRNEGKLKEFKRLLENFDLDLLSLNNFPELPAIVEDGLTFEENVLKKAVSVATFTERIAIADDSGLVVDYLKGEPGVMSARYAGANASDEENNQKLLDKLKGVPDHLRKASFQCALAIATPQGEREVVIGECQGVITHEPKGHHGFGYDPIFLYPEYGKTFAELEPEMKNRVSHRKRAIEKLLLILPRYLQ